MNNLSLGVKGNQARSRCKPQESPSRSLGLGTLQSRARALAAAAAHAATPRPVLRCRPRQLCSYSCPRLAVAVVRAQSFVFVVVICSQPQVAHAQSPEALKQTHPVAQLCSQPQIVERDFGMAAIYSLYIINKSGGLIYYKDYGSAGRMDTNDSLRVASLWHSMHAISQQLSPVSGCSGIELLQADTFDLHCFQSLTGTKFFVVCEPGAQHMETLLKLIYELYTDYVLKNPFYEMEMPIRCELFDINLTQAVQKDRVGLLGR